MTTPGFKDTFDHPPDWGDGGPIELLKDGVVVRGELLVDAWFNGQDEVPLAQVKLTDGTEVSFFDYDEWRPVEGSS